MGNKGGFVNLVNDIFAGKTLNANKLESRFGLKDGLLKVIL